MKIKLKQTLLLAMLFSCFGIFNSANAESDVPRSDYKNNGSLVGTVEKGKVLFSDYLCLENLDFSPETEHTSDKGRKIYRKNIVINKEFSKIDEDATLKQEAKISLDVTFTYDKESFVRIDDRENDIKVSKSSNKWKVGNLTEVFPGKETCLVSDTYSIYKKSSTGLGEHIVDGHVDLVCSKFGDLGFDTELN